MLKTFGAKCLFVIICLVSAYLQYLFWLGEGGYYEHQKLKQKHALLTKENLVLDDVNTALKNDVSDLKRNGLETIEEHARLDLGYIKPQEVFIQLNPLGKARPNTTDNTTLPTVHELDEPPSIASSSRPATTDSLKKPAETRAPIKPVVTGTAEVTSTRAKPKPETHHTAEISQSTSQTISEPTNEELPDTLKPIHEMKPVVIEEQ